MIWLFFVANTAFSQQLLWPLQSEPGLAASFCEFRPRHFHGGVDIKTWGARSRPCVAIDDGTVNRVKVQANGYGKALYLTLKNGNIAVYAHLDKFASIVAERVRAYQEATGNFEVDLFWEGDSGIAFKKGDVVAHSGVTGTVHPHLHFEIRDASQRPMNPLTNGLYVADHVAPIPVGIALTPLDGASTIEGDLQPRIYPRLLKQPNGVFSPGDPIGASGRIGISLDAYDQADAAANEMAAYQIDLDVSGETYWTTQFDQFDFDQTRMIEVERDYRLQRRGKGSYHRLYRVPGNRLACLSGDGIIDAGLADSYPIDIQITISDVAGNSSKVVFQIVSDQVEDTSRGVSGVPLIDANGWSHRSRDAIDVDWLDGFIRVAASPGVDYFTISGQEEVRLAAKSLPGRVVAGWTPTNIWNGIATIKAFTSQNKLVSNRNISVAYASEDLNIKVISEDSLCQVEIPQGSLYEGLWLELEKSDGDEIPGQISSVYAVEPRDQPLKQAVVVKIRKTDAARRDQRWGVYYFNRKMGWTFLGRESEGDFLVGKATSWERYALVLDSEAPSILVGHPKTGATNQSYPEFSAVIKDQLSGISPSDVIVRLDGRRIPADYDQPRARVSYKPWKPLARGKHIYEIVVTDRAGNATNKSVSVNITG